MTSEHPSPAAVTWPVLARETYRRKGIGLAAAAVVFGAILAYIVLLRDAYVATAQISVGYVAPGPTTFILIEPLDTAERHLQEETLPKLGLSGSCVAKVRAIERGGPVIVVCRAGGEAEARRGVEAIAQHLLVRHQERFGTIVRPLRQIMESQKQRLKQFEGMQQELTNPDAGARRRSASGPAPTFEQILLAKEVVLLQDSLEMNALLREMDKMTAMEPTGITVTKRPVGWPLIVAGLVLAVGFGIFISVTLAAVSVLRKGGYGRGA